VLENETVPHELLNTGCISSIFLPSLKMFDFFLFFFNKMKLKMNKCIRIASLDKESSMKIIRQKK